MTLISRSLAPTFHASLRPLARHWAALLALALFLVAGLAVLDDYGVTSDEPWQRSILRDSLSYLQGDWDALPNDHNKFYGIALEAPILLVERAFGLRDARDIYLVRHLLARLTLLTGGLFGYMLAYRLFGSRPLAVAATLLFLLHPRLYGHSFFNAKDIPFLAMFIIALYLTHRAFRRDSLAAFALLGAAVGVLVNLRIMGLILVAAVPALRALDLAFAQGREERKRILVTGGVFALGAPLAAFALLPYLWGGPIERVAEWWVTLSNHPQIAFELLRGTFYRSDEIPVEYLPVWLSITTPPFALLLGAAGSWLVLARAARAPRNALRSRDLRFGLLLVGCFALPVFAVMLPGGNMYNGWRQMYFLWAPFALLAAFGLRGLAGALGGRARMAVYGAAGAGFAATVISMALIHPNQQDYFNVLVDRVTPEHLSSQYVMDYWDTSLRQGLEWIVEHSAESSGGAAAITASRPTAPLLPVNALMLPKSARERLADAAPFDIIPNDRPTSWAHSGRALHRVKAYDNTTMIVESRDDLRDVYEAVRGREPLIDGALDVHRIDGALALVVEPCAPSVVESEQSVAILRAFPVDAGDLPSWRLGKAFEPRIFHLMNYGAFYDGKCVASLPLPAHPIADFELLGLPELMEEAEAQEKARRARDEGRLLARAAHRAAYDVYLADGELAYLNESCDPLETEQPFHLNAHPERVSDLPEEHRERGYERFHFEFLSNGAFADGGCAAFFPLPDYPVAGVWTGQYDGEGKGGNLWFAEFWIDPARRWADAAADVSGEPVARGEFNVHLADGALVYAKGPCEPADTEARFFLHVVPERIGDLPDERRGFGFDNLDFDFFPNGALFEGRCAARVTLPGYPVASVRTGQHVGGAGEIWSAEFAIGSR